MVDNEGEKKGVYDKVLDKLLNVFFSKDKTLLYLSILILGGFILRIIAARNLGVAADDVGHAIYAINFLESGKLEVYHQSASLWQAITSIFYKMFGTTQFASRFAAVLFGTFTIPAIFLLTKEFFKSKKIALLAGLLLAISPLHIKSTVAEHDVMVMFFVIFSMFFFVRGVNKDKMKFFVLSGLLMGLGIITKLYILLFIPALCLYAMYKLKKKEGVYLNKDLIKKLFVFGLLVLLFFTPALTHNYLLYKDKGIMDFQFTRVFGFGEEKAAQYYSWDAGWESNADFKGFFLGNSHHIYSELPTSIYALGYVFIPDPLISILGLIGLLFLFKRSRNYLIFFLFCFLIPFVYMASVVLLSKHYLFLLLLLIPPASFSLNLGMNKLKKYNIKPLHIVALLIIFSLIFLGFYTNNAMRQFYGKSDIGHLMDYKKNNIEDNALVIVDGRIYRGQFTWAFNDKHYLEASYVPQLFNIQEQLPGEQVDMPVYFIECVKDDCGWGNIKNQPEFNQSMEDLLTLFKVNYGAEEKITFKYITEEKYYFPFFKSSEGVDSYRVHKTYLPLKSSSLDFADSTHVWWLHPVGYEKKIKPMFDDYDINSPFDNLLNKTAHLILYMAILLCILSLFAILYIVISDK